MHIRYQVKTNAATLSYFRNPPVQSTPLGHQIQVIHPTYGLIGLTGSGRSEMFRALTSNC
ncbi:hypothetical protein SCLCIDRAFT_1212562 [Scleroderma citrinum Foug A]|uniref:Uncharacterized protein n=1 Tax=Scleroderma citrinum Foug A TaxID=1036808 RepID=A0A0C3AJK2_9AGAM|nr:hypothetical protein SCLCIDRAFT_1212562 [Scleroderma citrinum Foug A]